MTVSEVGWWLVRVLIFSLQIAFVYALIRLFIIGRPTLNPFKKGWSHLYSVYGTTTDPARMETTSAMIGIVTYSGTMSIAFEDTSIILKKQFFGSRLVRIPYRDITIVTPPRRVTVLRIPVYLDGLFEAAGVEISLKRPFAKRLIEELAQGDTPSASSR